MRSRKWNLNFAAAKEYKTGFNTTANITVVTVTSTTMTDADPPGKGRRRHTRASLAGREPQGNVRQKNQL